MNKARMFVAGHSGFIGWLIVTIAVVWALAWQHQLASQLERDSIVRATNNCESLNEMRLLIGGILDVLAEPRDDDEPGDYEGRLQLRERLQQQYLEPEECPPPPPDSGLRVPWFRSNQLN